ncbi:inositol monophosphatase family protein [Bacteroidota bacterium]
MMFLNEIKLAKKVAYDTAEMLQANFFSDAGVISNLKKDIKTEADRAAHEFIIDKLYKTGIPIISEEGNAASFYLNDHQWIIDPIDGTINFTRGFGMSAVSIALWVDGIPILGVIHHLFTNEVFSSFQNQGAFKNDKKITVNTLRQKNRAILATGFPSGRNYSKKSLDNFILNVQEYKKIRMLGSAALMLAYVACGYFDVYHEEDIYIWDVAAGLAIILEAGGKYSIEAGSSDFKYNIKATNNFLINKF